MIVHVKFCGFVGPVSPTDSHHYIVGIPYNYGVWLTPYKWKHINTLRYILRLLIRECYYFTIMTDDETSVIYSSTTTRRHGRTVVVNDLHEMESALLSSFNS